MIAIVDYDIGNLRSVQKALEKVGADARLTRNPDEIVSADGVVLPGVGAFRDCMNGLANYGLTDAVREAALGPKPFLGICVGMQMLFESSVEYGDTPGLGLIPGVVRRFEDGRPDPSDPKKTLKVPLMGWNKISLRDESNPLLKGIEYPYFYFVHSYYAAPADASNVLATAEYGLEYCAATHDPSRKLYGTQFHPEKSQKAGLALLTRFMELC